MRAAIYWAPALSDPIWDLGSQWLGRDAATGTTLKQPDVPNIVELTSTARLYGFHCTLRSPMRLATSLDEFCATAEHIARASLPFPLPPLEPRDFGGFLALGLTASCPEIRVLADLCVRETDRHRAPLAPAEAARRRAPGLSRRQEAMLRRWGYPYVMEEWFFHTTLTRRLNSLERDSVVPQVERHFGTSLATPRMVDEICVFTQKGGDFLISERFALR
jgi:Protein of unknown function (DUF1045)